MKDPNAPGTGDERHVIERSANTQFMLAGFTQEIGFRVFAFRRTGADRDTAEYTVRADLALSRRYGIPMQELPLLCRRLLERRGKDDASRVLIFTEAEMSTYANDCATARAAAAEKKRPHRRPPNENVGLAWRTGQPNDKQ
jgi:hypothetical protein